MKKRLTTTLAFALLMVLPSLPANAATKPQLLGNTGIAWIVGKDVNSFSCWSLASTKQIPTLQVKVSGKWITKAKAKLSKNASLCADAEYPWVATYHWVVNEMGGTNSGTPGAGPLMVREYFPKIKGHEATASAPFVKLTFNSRYDLNLYFEKLLDGIMSSGL